MPELTPFTKAKVEKFDDLYGTDIGAGTVEFQKYKRRREFLESALQEQQEGFMEALNAYITRSMTHPTSLLDELKKRGLIS